MALKVKLGVALAVGVFAGFAYAQELIPPIPGPAGLTACKPEDPVVAQLTRAIPQSGVLSGCFKSNDLSRLSGASKPVSVPTETGFSITLSAPDNGHFTEADVDRLFSKTQDQWKHVKPLWDQDRASYERRVQQLIGGTSRDGAVLQDLSIQQPTLISMNRRSPRSYVVVNVRHLAATTAVGKVERTVVDGGAVILRNGGFVRLTLLREFQKPDDIGLLKKDLDAWVVNVEKAG